MRYSEFAKLWEEKRHPMSPLAKVVAHHTGHEGAAAAWLADRLHSHGIINGFRVYDRTRDIEALRRLERAIGEIERVMDEHSLTGLAHERLFMELFWSVHLSAGEKHELEPGTDAAKSAIQYIENEGRRDSTVLSDAAERGPKIRAGIRRTISEIERSPFAKVSASKINERGIALVDASRFIWQLATEESAPSKDLNPASRFGKFLADIFEACEVPGDPRSAFRAWVREKGDWSLDERN